MRLAVCVMICEILLSMHLKAKIEDQQNFVHGAAMSKGQLQRIRGLRTTL